MEKLQRICLKIIALCGMLIFGYLFFHAWTSSARIFSTSEVTVWTKDALWKNLLFGAAAVLAASVVGFFADRIGDKALHGAAIAVSLAVTAGCCFLVRDAHGYPDADQIYVYEAAENFFSRDYTNIRTEWYFNACPYQLGLGLLYGLLMRLCGSDGYQVIQYAHSVCAGLTVYGLFRITGELFHNKRVSAAALLCAGLFLPMYLYTLYLYGETFGLCFAVLGMLFWLLAEKGGEKKRSVRALYTALSAVCLAVCFTARLALVVVPIAILLTALLKSIKDKRIAPAALATVILLFALGAQKLSVAFMEKQADTNLADGMPAILTVAMGIQDETENETGPGSYNAYNLWLYFGCGFDEKSASAEAFQDIRRTLYRWSKDPAYMADYMNRKVLNQWNEATYGGFFMTAGQRDPKPWVAELYGGKAGDRWYSFLNLYQGMLYFTWFFYFFYLFVKGKNVDAFLPGLLLAGEFCFSMIWEAKSRYVYPYIVMALPCTAFSLVYCSEKLKQGWRKIGKETVGWKNYKNGA